MKIPQSFFALAGTLLLVASPLQGQTYTETGDAGQTLGTAQATSLSILGAGPFLINGTIGTATDADVFSIQINSPMFFSATTVGGSTLDTALFLFNSSGAAVYTNDDASGSSFQSTLPGGSNFTMSLAPGLYYIAISLSGNEPINSNGQLLFNAYTGGDPTSVRGAAAGVNPATLANFNGFTSFAEMGGYQISLSAVPEPTTAALCLGGAAVIGLVVRKRRKARTA